MLLSRLAWAIGTVWLAASLAFLLIHLAPGDIGKLEFGPQLLTRLAQVTRHRLHADCGAAVGAVQHLIVEGVTVADYFAAMASLKAPRE